jgi:hypothetical protein
LKFHSVDFLCLICPVFLTLALLISKRGRNFRDKAFCPFPQSRFVLDDTVPSVEKIASARQAQSAQARTARSSSRKAVNFSSARTMNRFPSSRCASAIQIVRPLESIAETQPQLQLALLRLSVALLVVADHLRRIPGSERNWIAVNAVQQST